MCLSSIQRKSRDMFSPIGPFISDHPSNVNSMLVNEFLGGSVAPDVKIKPRLKSTIFTASFEAHDFDDLQTLGMLTLFFTPCIWPGSPKTPRE